MGIPRLMQDLQPHLETVTVGRDATLSTEPYETVTNLVIDGPSLVYFIYTKLLALAIAQDQSAIFPGISYKLINDTTLFFLRNLDRHGVEIDRIYFDGGLPKDKRGTRLNRLEKTRLQLEYLRKSHPENVGVVARSEQACYPREDEVDFDDILWNSHGISTRRNLPPPPPFMVAGVIERLRQTWSVRPTGIVEVVPGEADQFCAQRARYSGAAVLTNDSDLTLYELGERGCVVFLNTLEKSTINNQGRTFSCIEAQALRPGRVVQALGVPSMLRYGFQRFKDASVSAGIVRERARQDLRQRDEAEMEFEKFATQYLLYPVPHPNSWPFSKVDLDPRIAEVVSQLLQYHGNHSHNIHVYHPILEEDPSRDASWSYGMEYRQIAYSSLLSSSPNQLNVKRPRHMLEYFRKGQRIAPQQIELLDPGQVSAMLQDLQRHFDTVFANVSMHIQHPRQELTIAPFPKSTDIVILLWCIFALDVILKQKVSRSAATLDPELLLQYLALQPSDLTDTIFTGVDRGIKARRPHKSRTVSVKAQRSECCDGNDFVLTWSLQHLHANVQAILYSLRILEQVLRFMDSPRSKDKEARALVTSLTFLMPIGWTCAGDVGSPGGSVVGSMLLVVEGLFLGLPDLRLLMRRLPVSARAAAFRSLIQPK